MMQKMKRKDGPIILPNYEQMSVLKCDVKRIKLIERRAKD
jgi:hypothetical protein